MSDISDISNNYIRFSEEESIAHYTVISHKFTPKEIIQNGGITSIATYCKCRNKTNCNCKTRIIHSLLTNLHSTCR